MILTRYLTETDPESTTGIGWALNNRALPFDLTLAKLLSLRQTEMVALLGSQKFSGEVIGTSLTPVEHDQEVWACGVTYLKSRVEREAESTVADVYAKVYEADRPEIFFKAAGWRVVGDGDLIRIRRDSAWNVPEPELTLVVNRFGEIVGYTAGNDVSSRSIEGENPLYLPQAKCYDGACAIGASIRITGEHSLADLPIELSIRRRGVEVFAGEARTSQMKRSFQDLVDYLFRETTFPYGVFVMTGTGIVPTQDFTLHAGDEVAIKVGEILLTNEVSD